MYTKITVGGILRHIILYAYGGIRLIVFYVSPTKHGSLLWIKYALKYFAVNCEKGNLGRNVCNCWDGLE